MQSPATGKCIDASSDLQQAADGVALLRTFAAPPAVRGLYLHIPFCFHKCHYCDFYSIVDDHDRQAAFAARMIAEIRALAPLVTGPIETIFVGGGTPTLLRPELWQNLLDTLHTAFDLSHLAEFTVEANPETLTPALLDVLVPGGVNRMSVGAQSFNPAHLKTLERWHDPENVGRAIRMACEAGITNLNLDLIFAVPGQTPAEWQSDLDRALSLEPMHLSCYSLMYEPNTPLAQKLKMGLIQRLDEDIEAQMFRATIDTLTATGFEHYEVSNFAKTGIQRRERGVIRGRRENAGTKADSESAPPHLSHSAPSAFSAPSALNSPSFRCRHNMLYWLNENWLAIGPSASGHLDGIRWKNAPHLGKYLASDAGSPIVDVERLDADQSLGEQLMLRLRLNDGASLDWLQRALSRKRQDAIAQFLADGLLEQTATHLRLTPRGLMIADSIFTELL